MDKQYITNIHMEFRGKWYKPGDQIPASVLGLQRNINFLLSRGRIQPIEADTDVEQLPAPIAKHKGGRPRKGSA